MLMRWAFPGKLYQEKVPALTKLTNVSLDSVESGY